MDIDFSVILNSLETMLSRFLSQLPMIALGLMVFVLFFILARPSRSIIRGLMIRAGAPRGASMAIARLSQWGIILFGILASLSLAVESFNAGELISLLGIGSVAIGFAFRDILQNFLAGLLILLTEPFRVGDQIIFNDYEGTVEQISTRATMINTYDGRRVVIPSSDLFTNSVLVNTTFEKRRSHYDVGIGYGDDIDTARQLILQEVNKIEEVCDEPAPEVLVWDLASSTVNLRVRWWTDSRRSDVVLVMTQVLEAVTTTLSSAGIDMPFPTQVVLFHDQTEATDGNRTLQREGWPPDNGETAPQPMTIAGSLSKLAEVLNSKASNS